MDVLNELVIISANRLFLSRWDDFEIFLKEIA